VVVNLLTLSLSHARHLHRGQPGRNPVVGPQAPVSTSPAALPMTSTRQILPVHDEKLQR